MNAKTDTTPNPDDKPATTPASPSTDAAMHADVDAHAPVGATTVTLGDHTFTIAPMKVRQVFPFLQLARPIFAALTTRPSSPQSGLPPAAAGLDQGGEPSTDAPVDDVPLVSIEAAMGDADWMLDMLETHGPAFIKALAVGIESDAAKIEDLTVVDLVVLAKHFVTVNAGFFADRGLRLPQNLPGIGAVASVHGQATARAPKPRKR